MIIIIFLEGGDMMLLLLGEKLEGFGKVVISGTVQSFLMYRRPLPLVSVL